MGSDSEEPIRVHTGCLYNRCFVPQHDKKGFALVIVADTGLEAKALCSMSEKHGPKVTP